MKVFLIGAGIVAGVIAVGVIGLALIAQALKDWTDFY